MDSPHLSGKWERVSRRKASLVRGRCRGCGGTVPLFHLWAERRSLVVRCSGCIVEAELRRLLSPVEEEPEQRDGTSELFARFMVLLSRKLNKEGDKEQ